MHVSCTCGMYRCNFVYIYYIYSICICVYVYMCVYVCMYSDLAINKQIHENTGVRSSY
jgi:hypothetical protein